MNSQRLSSEEIENLYAFCYEHDVDEFEIQAELVDHLASDMEQQWQQHPARSFDEALQKAFASFGMRGFSEVVKKRKRAFRRRYRQLFWRFFLSFFQLPRILASGFFLWIVYFALRITGEREVVLYTVESILLASYAWYMFFYYPKRMKLEVVDGNRFLLTDYYGVVRSLSWFIYIAFQTSVNVLLQHYRLPGESWIDGILALIIVVVTISMVVLMFYLPRQMKNHFVRDFPQFIKM